MRKERLMRLMAMAGMIGAVSEPETLKLISPPMFELPPLSAISYGGSFEFYPRRKKFKGYQREQKLGRRRSKYYFNKNK